MVSQPSNVCIGRQDCLTYFSRRSIYRNRCVSKTQREEKETISNRKNEDLISAAPISGFLLVPNAASPFHPQSHHHQDVYLLSVPHVLLQQVSQAAAFNLDVVITRYILARFRERAKGNPSALVEIFTRRTLLADDDSIVCIGH